MMHRNKKQISKKNNLHLVDSHVILDSPSKLGEHGTNKLIKCVRLDNNLLHGAHGSVFFVSTPKRKTKVAVKSQVISDPESKMDRAYRELRILHHLNNLNCKQFVSLLDWFKLNDLESQVVEEVRSVSEDKENIENLDNIQPVSASKTPKRTPRATKSVQITPSRTPKKSSLRKGPYYIYYMMECAEKTLGDCKTMKPSELRAMLLQIFHALAIAQRELEFVHYDLHKKNILIQSSSEESTFQFQFESGEVGAWKTSSILVKICDFGLSRIKLVTEDDEELIFNPRNLIESDSFFPGVDMERLEMELKSLKVLWDLEYDSKGDIATHRKNYNDLKKKMRNRSSPESLLKHPFFQPLVVEATTDIKEVDDDLASVMSKISLNQK